MGIRSFNVAFDFAEGVPRLTAEVNGTQLDRFFLDTGAPSSYLHKDVAKTLGLSPDPSDAVHVDSLRCGNVEFGPLQLKVTSFGQNRIQGVLGTREIKSYCVTLDLDDCVCRFETEPDHGRASFSRLELLRGRPTVHVEYAGIMLRFVFDTGSDGNWLFARGQEKLARVGRIAEESGEAKSARGNLTLSKGKILRGMRIGGSEQAEVRFLVAGPDDFGGLDAPEDGILGLSAVAPSGLAIIDLPGEKLLLKRSSG